MLSLIIFSPSPLTFGFNLNVPTFEYRSYWCSLLELVRKKVVAAAVICWRSVMQQLL